jgi:hypothetical protein
VVGIINMTGKAQTIKLNEDPAGSYTDAFSGSTQSLGEMKLAPWQYLVLIKK